MRKLYLLFIAIYTLFLSGCGGGTCASTTPINPPTDYALSINNTGIVPVLGNSATSTVVYIHNNTNTVITNITLNSLSSTTASNITNVGSISVLCSSVAAHQSCPVSITTPVLTDTQDQGSMLIELNYVWDGKTYSVSNVVSYAKIFNNIESGAVITSGVELNSFGNQTAHAMVYVYGSGTGAIYDISQLILDNPGFSITQGDIQGQQIQSGYVQAIEVSASADILQTANYSVTNSISATLSIISNNVLTPSVIYTSTADLGVIPLTTRGAILTAGAITPVDTSTTNPSGSLVIVNSGDEVATLGSTTFPNGVTAGTPAVNECGTTLVQAGSCVVTFNIVEGADGSGMISIPYSSLTGGSSHITQNVTWYNGVNAALVNITFSANPVVFNQTQSGTTQVTVTNIGGYLLSNVAIDPVIVLTGGATASIITPLECRSALGLATGTELAVGGNCTYTISLSNTSVDTGTVSTGITATYLNESASYARSAVFDYQSISYLPSLLFTPNPLTMNIEGNNRESALSVIILTNVGAASATIDSAPALTNAPNYLTIESSTCGASLASFESCLVTVKLGPTTSSSGESGVANLSVSYSGAALPSTTYSSDIDYTVTPNDLSVGLSVNAIQSSSGDGSSANPYIFNGSNTNSQAIVLTITNTGNKSVTLSGINNTTSGIMWMIDMANSSCYSDPSNPVPNKVLESGASCTIDYSNVLLANSRAANIGSSYTGNITIPNLVFQDLVTAHQFEITPTFSDGTEVYATNHQATVANSLSIVNGRLVVTNSLANASGYTAVSILSRFESYISSVYLSSANCTISSESGIVNQNCSLTQVNGVAIESVTYTLNKLAYGGEEITTLFSVANSNSQVVGMSPLYANVVVPSNSFAYFSENNGGSLRMCSIRYNGIFFSCTTPSATDFGFVQALTLSNNRNYLYISSGSNGLSLNPRLNKCRVSESGSLVDCSLITGIDFTSISPYKIVFNTLGTQVFISYQGNNGLDSGVYTCQVNSITGEFSNCINGSALSFKPSSLSIESTGSIMYMSDISDSKIYQCSTTIISDMPVLDSCNEISFNGGIFTNPGTITRHPRLNLTYIPNNSYTASPSNDVMICPLYGDGSMSTDCVSTGASPLNGAANIAFNTNSTFMYVTNTSNSGSNNTIIYCPIDSTGVISTCSNTGSNVSAPQYIVIK